LLFSIMRRRAPTSTLFPYTTLFRSVTKTDFIGDNGVVLVDDRHHIQIEQGAQGAARIEIALAVGEVVMGDEDLCGLLFATGEACLPGSNQPHLPYSCSSLQFVHCPGTSTPAKATHARSDGTGRYQHQLDTRLTQRNHLVDPDRHRRLIEATPIGRQQRTADLHYPAPSTAHLVAH